MEQHKRLKAILKPHLGWHGARLDFLALFLLALIRVKSVNLTQIAQGFSGRVQSDSNYKRLQRFFRWFEFDYSVIAKLVVALMEIPQPWVLSLDRTEWKFGTHPYNILMLGIVHEGVAMPVVWSMLDKQGNSNTEERIDLLERFTQVFPDAQIAYLTADREFIGQVWTRYLRLAPSIPFRLRLRHSDRIERNGQALKASVVFAHLQPEQVQVLSGECRVWGYRVTVGALRLSDGQLLVVISPDIEDETLIADYAARWGIETLFGIFKSRGFCLESTHFNDDERLSKLFALLTLALCWTMQTGLWLHQLKPIKIKKHGRRAKSLFRYGFDHLRQILLHLESKTSEFDEVLKLLSCT
jgi:hypothetical protein